MNTSTYLSDAQAFESAGEPVNVSHSSERLGGECLNGETVATSERQQGSNNYKIMVVDDVPLNVKLASAHLSAAGYKNIVSETDSTKALSRLYQEQPDLLLLDIMMPHVSGLDILTAVRCDKQFSHLPVLILTAATDREMKIQALELGATDFLTKPLDAQDLLPRVHNALLVKSHQDDLELKVRQRTQELQHAQEEVVICLARAAEYRDNETGRHVIRVSRYVAIIARELGLAHNTVALMEQAATLHDMGKVGIPDAILLKPGKLTEEEFSVMKKHCVFGADICSGLITDSGQGDSEQSVGVQAAVSTQRPQGCTSPLLKMAGSIAATHHEKWDGSGYPNGLKGEQIPLEGRITAVADVFDALSSRRPYKEPFPLDKCVNILEEGRSQHFDPQIVDVFLSRLDEVVVIRDQYADE